MTGVAPLIEVDVAGLRAGEGAAHDGAVAALARAGRTSGAFALTGHGVPAETIEGAFAAARAFFALPADVKRRYAAGRGNLRGYHPLPEGPGDVREKLLVTSALGRRDGRADTPMPGENRWPDEVPGFREAVEACHRALEDAGRATLRGLSQSLGLAPGELGDAFDPPGGSCLWLLHYPATPWVGGRPGQGTSAHTDLHPLAIIVQDEVGGLEVRDASGWRPVDPRAQPVACQMGDLVARWTNDVYRPNTHRVASPTGRSRYSLALFMQPAFDAVIAPAPTCVGPARPARYAPSTFAECLEGWFRALEEGRGGYVPGA